ncbi:SIS domain-containing protein [Bradyrhizobium manausense]|nr:SIS domain-containing protein [Bradyrhizobium manausense]
MESARDSLSEPSIKASGRSQPSSRPAGAIQAYDLLITISALSSAAPNRLRTRHGSAIRGHSKTTVARVAAVLNVCRDSQRDNQISGDSPAGPHARLDEAQTSPVAKVEHVAEYLREVCDIAQALPPGEIEALCDELVALRERGGRLFILGVGGSAANASHAVNDFRKLCGIEAYAPTDNVSELSARTNDEGWPSVFVEWLKVSRIGSRDAILVLSVGGGNLERNVSPNIVAAVKEAKAKGARVLGIVGRDGGYTKQAGDVVVVIPTASEQRVTPHAEAFQAVVWHCLVSHPKLQRSATKW